MSGEGYIAGDYWMICDRSGFKVRVSGMRKTWDGYWVRDEDWEPRQPQDFVRGQVDRQRVPVARPRPDEILGDSITDPADIGD